MTWFRLDDGCAFHSKVLKAGNEAWGALCRGGAWSSFHGTDGFVPDEVAAMIAPEKVWKKLASCGRKGEAGLVERGEDGWHLHDFLDWNPSAADVAKARAELTEKRRSAGLAGNAKRWSGHTKTDRKRIANASQVRHDADRSCEDQSIANASPSPLLSDPIPSGIQSPDPDSDATHQADAAAPPPAPAVQSEPAVVPKQKSAPKAKQTSLPIAVTEPKPKAKKPNPVGDTIALYREPYKARYQCTYVTGGKDTEIAKTLNAKARSLAAELAPDDPDGWSKCLTHWMLEYLDNEEPYYVENRHPLRLIDQRLNDYGNPWETPREVDTDFEWGNIPPPHPKDPPGTVYSGPDDESKRVIESFLGEGALDGFTPASTVNS